MIAKCLLLLSATAIVRCGVVVNHLEQGDANSVEGQGLCDSELCEMRNWNLSLHRYQNQTGGWVDLSLTGDDWGRSSTDSNMGVKATVFECQGRKMIRLHATIKDPIFFPKGEPVKDDRLKFHQITGENVALANDDFTAMKKDTDKHDVVFSSRPLKSNEMFEIRIDKYASPKRFANAIGVTTYIPIEGQMPHSMNGLKSGTWMLYHNQIWHNGSKLLINYIDRIIDKLEVGDRLGVMRTEKGVLHFYINGKDLGPAATGVPDNVYGVFEFYGKTSQVTLIHPS